MNATESLASVRRKAAQLESEMNRLLVALSGMRDLDVVFPLESLEQELNPTTSPAMPAYAIRA
jgi:hypothetical protein